MAMLIQNVDIEGQCVDVQIDKGLIHRIGKNLSHSGAVFDGKGGALIPGLHDHHIHLNATAAAMNSVRCGPPEVETQEGLIKALNNASGQGWLRGVGYYQSVAGEIDRQWLDRYGPDKPLRIQHRSGRLWILNSLAMAELNVSDPVNGRLLDSDLKIRAMSDFPDLKPLIKRLLSCGITGVTEVTPSNGLAEYENYTHAVTPLRFAMMGRAVLSSEHSQHLKLHYHDHNLPALDALAEEVRQAHDAGRNVAAHCVTRAELMLTLAAIEMAGPIYGDRIEHAAIADDAAIEWMKKLGVIVVTQPNFIAERQAAYVKDVPQDDHKNLWRLAALSDAGLKLAAGSDAPFGDPNPWAAMAAAVRRPVGFEAESISPEMALALYTKPANDAGAKPRKIDVGSIADFCVLDRTWSEAKHSLLDVIVMSTWIGGALVYNRVN